MAFIDGSHQPRDTPSFARHFSWMAAVAVAFVTGYLVPRGEHVPAMAMAAVAPAALSASVAELATGNVDTPAPRENAPDAAVAEHEALDPVGVGRNPAQ